MKQSKALYLCVVCLLVTSCSGSMRTTVDEDKQYSTNIPLNHLWLQKHRKEIVGKTIQYVRNKHPSTAAWFPRLVVDNVRLETVELQWIKNDLIEKELAAIFHEVSTDILPVESDAKAWKVGIDVRFASPKINKAVFAALTPYMILCFVKSLFIVCPTKETSVVILDTRIVSAKGHTFSISAYGGSTLFMSTPWLTDNSAYANESEAEALAAAIADFADKFVAHVEKHGL